jgi:lysophospholipase L1-like esterase
MDRPTRPAGGMIVSMAGPYVALGDSMSIDAYAGGPGRGAASLLHRNRDADFPEWAGRDLASSGYPAQIYPAQIYPAQILASDGATSHDVVVEQLPLIAGPPALVTLTMGGNDLLTSYGDAAAARAAIDAVIANGETVLTELRRIRAGRVIVTTVYDPSDGTGELPTTGFPPWPDGPTVLAALNDALRGLAERHAATVADVHGAFLGHGVTAGDPGQPEPRPADRDLWYCGIIEPNAWGAHHIRRVWWDAIAG